MPRQDLTTCPHCKKSFPLTQMQLMGKAPLLCPFCEYWLDKEQLTPKPDKRHLT